MIFEKVHLITVEKAAAYAISQLNIDVAARKSGMSHWIGAVLGDQVTVYDLNGEPLFYDFTVFSPTNEPLGLVRASASRVLGAPVMSVYLGAPRWNVGQAFLRIRKMVEKKYKEEPVGIRLVCYAYPKLGMEILPSRKRDAQPEIIDIGDFSIVSEKMMAKSGEHPMRGPGAWSFYEQIHKDSIAKSLELFSA
jgi:hypothetical protein